MRDSITELLKSRVVLLDGGMGATLMARGLELGKSPELWNVERPDAVREVHAEYLAAGSDLVQSNTFGGSPFMLARHGLEDRTVELNREGVRVAREAAGEDRLVAGNIGPSGVFLAPVGDADPAALEEGYARQAAALAEGGADYISIETMMDLREALCALRGALSATSLPVTVCVTFDRKKRGFFTMMGNSPEDCIAALSDAGAAAVGANCSIGSDAMLELCPQLVEAARLPVIVKPNAGLPDTEEGRPVYRQDPADFARDMAAAVRLGARAAGGCCGTDARFIAALKKELDAIGPEGPGRSGGESGS
jgi:5-methyltetrahydrofolate--homocysteine methyltransferase